MILHRHTKRGNHVCDAVGISVPNVRPLLGKPSRVVYLQTKNSHFSHAFYCTSPNSSRKEVASLRLPCRFPTETFYTRKTNLSTPIAARVDRLVIRLSYAFVG